MPTLEEEICEEHARQAAFLWLLRDNAVRDAAYDLDDLSELDDRLEAHLDGLRLAGEVGWKAAVALLEDAEGGEVFGAAVVAVDRWDLRGLARVLDVGAGAPDLARGITSALGWTPWERVSRLLPGLLANRCPPALQRIGIAASAVHRQDPGAALGYAIVASDAALRARALRAAGELGRGDLLPEIRAAVEDADEACRFWAAWSAAVFGDPASAKALWAFANGGGRFAERAACIAVRRMPTSVAHKWLHALSSSARDPRVAVAAAGALGDPALAMWLIECMREPKLARLAGGALSMMAGIDLAAEKLTGAAPKGFQVGPSDDPDDVEVALDPDESLPWPDAAAVAEDWKRRGRELTGGTRYLGGKPRAGEWLERVLRAGNQPARGAAAIEMTLRQPRRAVFEVRAPGFWQRRSLAGGARSP